MDQAIRRWDEYVKPFLISFGSLYSWLEFLNLLRRYALRAWDVTVSLHEFFLVKINILASLTAAVLKALLDDSQKNSPPLGFLLLNQLVRHQELHRILPFKFPL